MHRRAFLATTVAAATARDRVPLALCDLSHLQDLCAKSCSLSHSLIRFGLNNSVSVETSVREASPLCLPTVAGAMLPGLFFDALFSIRCFLDFSNLFSLQSAY
jgi:hypothetical protein